jgi:hypothetical protein
VLARRLRFFADSELVEAGLEGLPAVSQQPA